ncbi:biotin-dependent carboxylase-like uncharacterized protein [Pseudonocardia eucalypti]|uniref:5-oxoprolinase subunit C family protein n=1 Tax=Pseudonocardia eucalypti TaxID=648755 RepID=UPI00185723AD|nr:biotin-dependent carboxylase-like uncharacterized protein [Pseudonocardia eucalypti]
MRRPKFLRARAVTVLRPGALCLVTDLGRPGYAELGVPRSGALDQAALRLANRLVGNPEGHAGLEVLLGGLRLRAEAGCTIAVTGAPVEVFVTRREGDRVAVGAHRAVYLGPGDELEIDRPAAGLRNYLACSGGLDLPAVLGSRSGDLLSGLGPPPVRADERLALGTPSPTPACGEPVPVSVPPARLALPILLGPRDDWFDEPADALRARTWTVDAASNRVGVRLTGEPLRRTAAREGAELPSEPMLPGSVQVPPSGEPVIFLADGPTTGGYPVIGVLAACDLPALAQARPGTPVTLIPRL